MTTVQPGGLTADVRARVIVCLPAAPVGQELVALLTRNGFEATHVERVEVLDAETKPAIVVVGDQPADWLRVVSDLGEHPAGLRVFVLASRDDPDLFLAALAAGAAGYCSASVSAEAIVRSIESVNSTGYAVPRSMTGPLVDHVRHGRGRSVHTAAGLIEVTDREWEILSLLMQRRSTREMADALFVSVGTVRSHVSTLLKKLGAIDREDAVRMVERGSSSQ